ncbi:copper resistance protein CopC [Virgibacillus dakarensis]|uniref:copper resistance CopC/CopD family protein n=1 Tax=Virgibacillus dakarensis TaxID=1917889 RepID=UPI000B440E2F|nr:copper resistance protein CopC [Virgibacillus dakarensis]MBT2215234.1 copper resistance protein CopC [Virgibacillus dakarensis]
MEMTPAEKVVAEESPPTLKLRFNEPIEQDLATVTIYDWNAKPVFTGNPDEGGPERSPLLEFTLPELIQGTYTVQWNVVSLDGHPVSGSYAFAIGEPTAGGAKSVAGAGENEGPLIAARTIVEGLILLGAGLFWFGWLAERCHFPSLDTIFKKGRRVGAAVLLLGTIVELATYGTALPPGLMKTVFNGRWDLLIQFPFILMLFAQLIALIMLLIPGMMRGWYLFMWLLLAVIPAFGGHVWGLENPTLALIPRIIHQLSIAFWLGALAYVILLVIWQRKQDKDILWKEFRPFFVTKMMIASGLVIVSGFIMVFLQTGWTAVITDWMGWSTLLLIKIILTILMLCLALFQTLRWRKREKFTTSRVIRVEWIVGLVVIVIGVWMSQTAYPTAVKSYEDTLADGQAKAAVYIDKLKTGDQKMTIEIPEVNGEQPEEVTVAISMPDHGMKDGPFTAEKAESGDYEVVLPFSMSGTWRLDIIAKYPGGDQKEWTDGDIFVTGDGNH